MSSTQELNKRNKKCVVGMDSTFLLYDMIKKGYYVEAISFDYGQRHSRELLCAAKTCEELQIPHNTFFLNNLFPLFLGSSLTDKEIPVPEGHYQAENMKSTVVPNRNSIMLNLAMAYAISRKMGNVAYGAHSGDHVIYPDCRPIFIQAIQALAKTVDYEPLEILVPFMLWKKEDIVKYGKQLGVNFANTYSCYKGGEKHCAKCGTCTERKEAFRLSGVPDPTEYEE